MRVRAYVRLAMDERGKPKVDAALRANPRPLHGGQGINAKPLHTIRFALDIDVDDAVFQPEEWPVAEIVVTEAISEKIAVEAAGL